MLTHRAGVERTPPLLYLLGLAVRAGGDSARLTVSRRLVKHRGSATRRVPVAAAQVRLRNLCVRLEANGVVQRPWQAAAELNAG